jgi:enoyl-CoA hydratase
MNVLTETQGPVTVVTLNRPETRNAVDRETATQLVSAFRRFEEDTSQSVAILTGAGSTFCSGADLKAIAAGKGNRVKPGGDGPMGPTRLELEKPVIAAIEGYAVAGGLELALWCDLRVASEDAVLGVFCRRWGVPLVDGGTVRLPRLVGHGRAMDRILTGREVDAAEALEMGLVNRIAPPGKALDMALELAEQLARLPQTCLRSDRKSTLAQWSLTEKEALEYETRLGQQVIASGETVEGAGRFARKQGEDE